MSRLVRLYPAAWRARYGSELEDLIAAMRADGRSPWRLAADVVRGAGREHLRSAGGRGGLLLVLWAWALMVVAGAVVQKTSEHWQRAVRPAGHGPASAGFTLLLVAAGATAMLVAAGIALALPATARFVRRGGLGEVREHVLTALALSLVAVLATVALVLWASHLSAADRAGNDDAYAGAFIAWAVLGAAALAAWTALSAAVARRIELSAAVLRAEAVLSAAVALALALITAGTALWWAAVARHAPGFFGGLAIEMIVALTAMVAATALGGAGAWQAVRAGSPPPR